MTMLVGHGIAMLSFDPVLPLWLVGALALAAFGAASVAVIRRARGWPWRAAALAVLVAWLAGPRLIRESWQNLPDIGILLLDRTASMQVDGRTAEATAAAARLRQEARRFPGLELRTVAVPNSRKGTQLFAALDRALAEVPRGRLAGVIAITDGEVADVPPVAKSPLEGAPLSLVIPARGEQIDRSLELLAAPTYGIVGKTVTIEARVNDHGVRHPTAAAEITIRRNAGPPQVESVPVGRPVRIQVPITRAGRTVVALKVQKLSGEVSTLNNSAVASINGVRDRLHVLLVSGEPNPGVRAWRRLLKSDPAVDLVHFTILRPPDKEDGTPLNELALIAFPAHELFVDKLRHFDLIILDQFMNDGLLPPAYLQNIARYVRGGGALLMTAGPEFVGPNSLAYTPLARVLPAQPLNGPGGVVVGAFRPRLTGVGERHPVTADLPGWRAGGSPAWGPWYRYDGATAVHGEVLMKTPSGAPLLVLNRVGKGRVAMLLSDQLWLWARGHDGGGPQAELMRRVAHWLMKEPALEENAVTARIEGGRLLVGRRTLAADAAGTVQVKAPNGRTVPLRLLAGAPGRAAASMPATMPGVWRVTEAAGAAGSQDSGAIRSAFAAAGAADRAELADLRATASRLLPLVRASGGSVHWLRASGVPRLRRVEPGAAAGGRSWIGLRRNHAHLITGITAIPLLPAWAALALLLGLMVLAWQREGAEPEVRQPGGSP
ncbi:MAG: hypothetical protein M0002_05090 [Rhodospirillales bacterium]|nr:hypothetical protein [Rhodospirillales bacterium]